MGAQTDEEISFSVVATLFLPLQFTQNPTSNGGCRREEKSRKHWSLFTMLLTSVTKIFLFFC